MIKMDQRVMIHSTCSNELDGKYGTILGGGICLNIGVDYMGWNTYIVLLDQPLFDRKAILLTDACLEPLN